MPNSKQIVYLSQAQYAELIVNGSITVDGVTVTYDENDIYVTPQAEPVTDVRVAGTSVAVNGVANIPIASSSTFGTVKVRTSQGITISNSGELATAPIDSSGIKGGTQALQPLTAAKQHESTFYGLAKASGDTTQSQSSNSVGTYTPEAKGAIQKMLGVSNLIGPEENNLVASQPYQIGDIFTANGKLYKATAAIAADAAIIVDGANANAVETSVGEGFPHDVQVNGVSVVQDGVANVPLASSTTPGVMKYSNSSPIVLDGNGSLTLRFGSNDQIKAGTTVVMPSSIAQQHAATFYGLAKAAGDTTQSASSNMVGTYTNGAKAAIQTMLGVEAGAAFIESNSDSNPVITGVANTRYVCGEVQSINITPPSNGIIDVIFTSGTSPAVLTLPNTVKFPEWFDAENLETNTIYEINITDGIYGAVMTWLA